MPETEKIRVYYLASGDIGIPLLKALLKSERLELAGVASQLKQSKSAGPIRTSKSPVVEYCEDNGVAIQRFPSVNTEEFYDSFRKSGAELLIVASYGQILKQTLLDLPKFGCLNVHASLLPKYRGASPIVAALLNGDAKTGISFMRMEAGLDTGPIYRTVELDIAPNDNAETLEERLGTLAGQEIDSVVEDITRHGLQPVPQPESGSTYAKKISKEDSWVNWERSNIDIVNMLRAYTPWPNVRTLMPLRNGMTKMVKITEVEAKENGEPAAPGTILEAGRGGILVACGKGALLIRRLTPEGKRNIDAGDYLLGFPLPNQSPCICGRQ